MKTKLLIPFALLCLSLSWFVATNSGCTTTTQNRTYQTLYTVGHTTDAAYSAYLDLVVNGSVKTNGVPKVSAAYRDFQIAYGAAIAVAQFNPQAVAPTNVINAASSVINAIQQNK